MPARNIRASNSNRKTKIILITASVSLASALFLQGCGKERPPNSEAASKTCVPSTGDIFVEIAPEIQPDVLEQGMGRRTLRKRDVAVRMDAFKRAVRSGAGGRIRMGLFSGKQIDIEIESVQSLSEDNAIVTGKIAGEATSTATIVMKDEAFVANIHEERTGEHYEVRHSGDGVHTVRSLGPDSIAGCAAIPAPAAPFESTASIATPEDFEIGNSTVLATPVIDMLVGYTPAARASQGGTSGMQALIQMGVADTNRALTDSGANLRVRLVGMLEMTQNESSDFYADLDALRLTTDGKWDLIHSVRKRLGADQVTLVGLYAHNYTIAGIGYVNATASSAFTIVRTSAFGMYTFSHEFGHNLGLNHEDGLENPVARFRTIMAYGTQPRIRRFSNPNIPYNGAATGDSTHHSVKIINANAAQKAALVETVIPYPTPTPIPSPRPTSEPTPYPTPKPTATPAPTPTPAASATPGQVLASPGSSNGGETTCP